MKTCDDCSDQWDCTEPCLEVIAWKDLEDKHRIKGYKPKEKISTATLNERVQVKTNTSDNKPLNFQD